MEPAVDGELYISGPCLARGYLGRPDITANCFLADPFSTMPGERMYRTRDRVRRLDNGLLQFKGQTDRQVKVNGVRIELDGIDSVLSTHPDVLEATTVLRPTGNHHPRLVAFVVRRLGCSSCSVEDLRRFLANSLPEAMIPRIIVFINDLPRTVSGKIDGPALMSQDIPQTAPTTPSLAPQTQIECIVAKCWEETLGLTEIGIEDDFFELGGDSIQATKMMFRLQKLLPEQLLLGSIFFQSPTLGSFVNAIESELGLRSR
jgi:acyl carrier protein